MSASRVGATLTVALLTCSIACTSDSAPRAADNGTTTSEYLHPRDRPFVPTTESGVSRNIAREVAAELGCEFIQEIGHEAFPIRGGPARRGVTCELDGVLVDVFEWSGEGALMLPGISHVAIVRKRHYPIS